jgi:hypothetical protein
MVSEGERTLIIRRISDFHRSCVRPGVFPADGPVPLSDRSARCSDMSIIRINRRIKAVESLACGQGEKFPNVQVERKNVGFPSGFPERGGYPS